MLVGSMAMPASASNYKNTTWGFTIAPDSTVYTTPLREKTDASGTYVHYRIGTKDYLSCDVLNSENDSMCKKTGGIDKGEEGLIAQYVYERGFRWAKLKLVSPTNTDGGANGDWSPDSVGSYHYINL